MKCSNCGHDISRRAVFCSNCGMEIKDNYKAVDDAIIESASRVNTKILRILSIVFALLLAIGLVITTFFSFAYKRYHRYESNEKYAMAHLDELEHIIASNDYYVIDRYYTNHAIYFSYDNDKDTHYNSMGYTAASMRSIINTALDIQFASNRYNASGSSMASFYSSVHNNIEAASEYQEGTLAKNYYENVESDLNMILKVYFGVSDEEIGILESGSVAENTILFDSIIKEKCDGKR